MEGGGTDPLVLFAVGGVGVMGTLLGAIVNDFLARKREQRVARARQRRAVSAIVGELLDAVTILDTARGRDAWWPLGDGPRDRAWVEYSDDLGEVLDDDSWHQVRMTYETVRSLAAMREEPDRRLRRNERATTAGVWARRWTAVPAAAEDSWNALWGALDLLRPHHRALARPEDAAQMDREAEGVGPDREAHGEVTERAGSPPEPGGRA